jgi:hypothetical protein
MPVLYYARGHGGTFGLTASGTLEARRLAVIAEARRLSLIAKSRGKGTLVTELSGWILRMAKNFIGPNLTQVAVAETRLRAIGVLLTVAPPAPSVVSPSAPSGPAPSVPTPGEQPIIPAYLDDRRVRDGGPPQIYYPPGGAGDALAAAGISPMMLLLGAGAVVAVVLLLRR